jgi:hypothetical protein
MFSLKAAGAPSRLTLVIALLLTNNVIFIKAVLYRDDLVVNELEIDMAVNSWIYLILMFLVNDLYLLYFISGRHLLDASVMIIVSAILVSSFILNAVRS